MTQGSDTALFDLKSGRLVEKNEPKETSKYSVNPDQIPKPKITIESSINSKNTHLTEEEKEKIRENGYEVIDYLGRGGTAEVFKVKRIDGGERLALKKMNSDNCFTVEEFNALLNAFKNEGIVGTVAHDSQKAGNARAKRVNPTIDSNYSEPIYIVTPFIDGKNLEEIAGGKGVDAKEAARIIIAASEGSHVFHEMGFIDRDIKPTNIMVDKNEYVHLLDFGLAKEIPALRKGSKLNKIDENVGTPLYMSPEQAYRVLKKYEEIEIDSKTDIYSLGATYYFLLTGDHLLNHDLENDKDYNKLIRLIGRKEEGKFKKLENLPMPIQDIIRPMMRFEGPRRPDALGAAYGIAGMLNSVSGVSSDELYGWLTEPEKDNAEYIRHEARKLGSKNFNHFVNIGLDLFHKHKTYSYVEKIREVGRTIGYCFEDVLRIAKS